MSPPPSLPSHLHRPELQRSSSSALSVPRNSLLLGSQPSTSHSQLLPPPHMPSPLSRASPLPSTSSSDRPTIRLRPISQLGIGAWSPSPRLDGPSASSQGGSSHHHHHDSRSPLSTPSMTTTSPDILVTPDQDVRHGFSDVEGDEHHWNHQHQHHSPLIRQGRAGGAPSPCSPDVGRQWWNNVLGTATQPSRSPLSRQLSPLAPLSPTQHQPRAMPYDNNEEVDELADDRSDDENAIPPMGRPYLRETGDVYHGSPPMSSQSFLLRPVSEPGSASATPLPPPRRPSRTLPTHIIPPGRRGSRHGHSLSYSDLPPPHSDVSTAPSPSGSTISLPPRLSPKRRTKPTYLNRPHVPVYNRSKARKDGEPHFICGYVGPKSDLPNALPPPHEPCQSTSGKKADHERHLEEIHARDEAERVLRDDLELERAGRFLLDMAKQLSRIVTADPRGFYPLAVPVTKGGDGLSQTIRRIPHLELRAQADTVRTRIERQLPDPASHAYFDFVEHGCTEFRDIVMSRIGTYRIWICDLGCPKAPNTFGSQRSMDRHLKKWHAHQEIPPAMKGWFHEMLHQRLSLAELDAAATLSADDQDYDNGPGPSTGSRRRAREDSAEPPSKRRRARKSGSSDPVYLGSASMRVRQQTPEQKHIDGVPLYQAGARPFGDYRIKLEDRDADDDLHRSTYDDHDTHMRQP